MNQIDKDIRFMKLLLPMHYTVSESKETPGSIHCKSSIGIKMGDNEDDEHWGYVMQGIRKQFGTRFREVNHNTCTHHVDFIVYLKNKA